MRKIRHFVLSQIIFNMMSFMGRRSDLTLIRLTRIAEYFCKKDYYKKKIQNIRKLFLQEHPSLFVSKKLLNNINPNQKMKIVENFIINQLISGTNQRQDYYEKHGLYPPGFGVISPSMKCNLKCYGCYSALYDKSEELSFEEIDDIIMQMKEMGIYFIVISGGEPFFSDAVMRIFEKHTDAAFLVYTNGSLIDEKMADKIAQMGNLLPCISVEGFQKETDQRRGQGYFNKVLKAMELLKERDIVFAFSATLTRDNADIITSDDFIDFYIDKGAYIGWYFHYIPTGLKPDINLLPTPEQRDHLRRKVQYFRDNKEIFLGDFQNDGPVVGGCIAGGRKYFNINNKGDIEPCTFFHYSTHNIRNSKLKEALNSDFFKYLRDCHSKNKNLFRPCNIIDHPHFARGAIEACGACPTHAGAELTFTDLAPAIDKYSQDYASIADKAWEEYKLKKQKEESEE